MTLFTSYAGAVDTGIPDFPSTVDALQVRDAWMDATGIRTLIAFDSLRSLDLQHSTIAGAVLASAVRASVSLQVIESCFAEQAAMLRADNTCGLSHNLSTVAI